MSEPENVQSNEAASEINTIEQTPGFILPDEKGQLLRNVNRPEYDRLSSRLDTAYRKQAETTLPEINRSTTLFETSAEAEAAIEQMKAPESNVVAMQAQSDLITEAKAEMELLVGLNFEPAEIPLDITIELVDYLKMQRLAAQENYSELYPKMGEMLKEQPQERQDFFKQFVGIDFDDPKYISEITESTLAWMNRKRKQKNKGI